MERELVFTFAGTSQVIWAEQVLLEAGVPVKVMPLPSLVRAGCGICLRVPVQDEKSASKLLQEKQISCEQIYERKTESGKSIYTVWEE